MKYRELEDLIKLPYFTLQDIALLRAKLFPYQLSSWAAKGYLIKAKNGVYVFSNRQKDVSPIDLARTIYEPSYISLEFALSYYGFIPEMVSAITSVTTKANRTFSSVLGHYIFRHIKPDLFWGYTQMKDTPAVIAEPEKAILDYLYLNLSKLKGIQDFENIRFNKMEIAKKIDPKKFNQYLAGFGMKKLEEYAPLCLH